MGRPKRLPGPARARRTFSPEFKHEAVRLLQQRVTEGATLASVCRELEVSPEQLREWERQQLGARSDGAGAGETEAEELRRLRREVATLRQEREFLKKATAFFAKESR